VSDLLASRGGGVMAEPTVVCVLGMHRSGTSLVSRVLNLLGVALGPDEHLMGSGPENPRGYWESEALTKLNVEILATLGGTWSDPPDFPPGWEDSPALASLRRAARRVVEEDFGGFGLWGWKDPRTCLTLPFWQKLLPPMRFVLCVRNPMDVVESLARRESEPISPSNGLDLWFSYLTASLVHSTGHPRMVIAYEDLMKEPEAEVARLAAFVGCPGAERNQSVRQPILEFLDRRLWHHRTSMTDVAEDAGLELPAKSLYLVLRLAARSRSPADSEFLAALSRSCQQGRTSMESLQVLAANLQSRADRMRDRAREVRAQLKLRDVRLEEARRERERLRAQLRRRDTRLGEVRGDLERLRADHGIRGSTIEDLQTAFRLERRERKRMALELRHQEADLEGLRKEAQQANPELEGAHRTQEHLRAEVGRLEKVVAEQSRTLEAERRDGEHLRAELGDRQAEVKRLGRAAVETETLRHKLAQLQEAVQRQAQGPGLGGPPEPADSEPRAGDGTDQSLVQAIRAAAASVVPAGAVVLVVTEGDEELLSLEPAQGWHFPRGARDPVWAGNGSGDDLGGIANLEALRFQGAGFLLIPASSSRWLEQHAVLARHLDDRYERVLDDPSRCVIYAFQRSSRHGGAPAAGAALASLIADLRTSSGGHLGVLDWETGLGLAGSLPDVAVFSPPEPGAALPYVDASVDVVVVQDGDAARLAEARRVASGALAIVRDDSEPSGRGADGTLLRIEWVAEQPVSMGSNVSVLLIPSPGLDHARIVRSVVETLPPGFTGEVALVPASSTDTIAEVLSGLDVHLRLIEANEGWGFARRLNVAAGSVGGKVLVVVGGGVIPLPGWLSALLGTFGPHPRTGIVGAKIVGPDGVLREAGGTVLTGGSRRRVGWGSIRPGAPPHNHMKLADFCSAPLFATPRWVLEEVNGLAETYGDPELAIVDYCLRLRERNLEVRFQPMTVAVQVSGEDLPELVLGDSEDDAEFGRRWGGHREGVLTTVGAPLAPEPGPDVGREEG
jgi:hypothetical protein